IISWVILLALAFTSTQAMQRKLGKHWQQLHNFVYLVAILAPIHYLWSVKIISPQPLIYAGLAVLLLALRYKKLRSLFNWLRKQVHNKLSV
ncbi:TPA: sulfoxide reductase heme-binding subunit YedZ, partial [Escherichia coli]|nr:sulfoxide reductase heme-binding subunit YedZ [Escherichia coli]